MKDTVVLWTRQDKRILDILESKGRFVMDSIYIKEKQMDVAKYYMKLYDWFSDKASEYVPRPIDVKYPIWCSISERYMLRKTEETVVLKLEIPRDCIIYFDGARWDMVLNHMYIPKDKNDDKEFKDEIRKRGIKNSFTIIDSNNTNFYPDLKRKIILSWDRVFEIDDWNDIFTIQANIWEIHSKWIIDIEK